MKFRYIILSLFFGIVHSVAYTQTFSVLTCSRGDEIYSTFGHSAIRYQDTSQGIDWVYNYGLFDFYDPNFIPKFCMGKLDYMVAKESMNDFMAQYVYQQREVKEQVLNLSTTDRDSLLKFLEWNTREENKYYRYDFLYNNCATKIIEVIKKNCLGVEMRFYEDPDQKSFRQLIHTNARNSVPWIDWGMDLALGLPVDKKATATEYCFLPEFVAKSIALGNSQGTDLVAAESILIPETPRMKSSWSWLWSPHTFAMALIAITVFLKWRTPSGTKLFNSVFFSILGIGGLIIGFEWFFTEHSVTKNNLNLLWLNPFFVFYSYAIFMNKDWKWLAQMVQLCLVAALAVSLFNIQALHGASRSTIMAALFLSFVSIKSKNNSYESR